MHDVFGKQLESEKVFFSSIKVNVNKFPPLIFWKRVKNVLGYTTTVVEITVLTTLIRKRENLRLFGISKRLCLNIPFAIQV